MSRKEKVKVIHEGKAKKLWTTEENEKYIIEFKDVVFNHLKDDMIHIEKKGFYNTKISERLFDYLDGFLLNTHSIHSVEDNKLLVHKTKPIPLVFILINQVTQEMAEPLKMKEHEILDTPMIQICYHDKNSPQNPLQDEEIDALKFFKDMPVQSIKQLLLKANAVLRSYFDRRGLQLYQIKFELGLLDDKPVLIDEITPDVMVVVDKETKAYLGRYAVIHSGRAGVTTYKKIYELLFKELFQPEYEKIKIVEDIPRDTLAKEFDEDFEGDPDSELERELDGE